MKRAGPASSASMDVFFLDDVGAEVEVNPDDVEVIKPKRKRKTTLLKKAEKKVVIERLQATSVDCHNAISTIIRIIDAENHVHLFKDRDTLWSVLRLQESLLTTIFRGLVEIFIHVFKSCEKGKDKYSRFQLEWHKHCSTLLTENVDEASMKELSQIHQRWLGFCEGSRITKDGYNPVMISICAVVYDYLMQQILEEQKAKPNETSMCIQQDSDDVYFRFGGAALASMLHLRYDDLKRAPKSKKDSIIAEIKVLKSIECSDKSHIPEYLQYRDKGYMYFPKMCFIPFIRDVDKCVCELANEEAMKKYGSKLVEVITQQVRSNEELKGHFKAKIIDVHDCEESVKEESINTVYLEFTRKLCNTRI